ncbi:MAG: multicopper oxidase domain-containing protein, partial [Proteobacteria bacterium]|nr:multicopper oxidase domain-containing protein [Pseudomonadota bacterium]
VDLETKEVTGRLADGVEYNFWTFGGTVPGPIIRIVEGDEVEFHLNNHSSWQTPHAPSCSDCLKAKL